MKKRINELLTIMGDVGAIKNPYPHIKEVFTQNFGEEQYGVGIRKGDTKFVDAFNKALDEVIADKTAGEISKKWFQEDILVK